MRRDGLLLGKQEPGLLPGASCSPRLPTASSAPSGGRPRLFRLFLSEPAHPLVKGLGSLLGLSCGTQRGERIAEGREPGRIRGCQESLVMLPGSWGWSQRPGVEAGNEDELREPPHPVDFGWQVPQEDLAWVFKTAGFSILLGQTVLLPATPQPAGSFTASQFP
uniref:Uncharacterized protein n=1 Tax=Pipistrellus kuhlii TaxID=59472 RepID=A0A7J7RGB5_PIPKU|nr:hypothetical protein mPipKuh1_002765 [Pipistrellus kuhlii]